MLAIVTLLDERVDDLELCMTRLLLLLFLLPAATACVPPERETMDRVVVFTQIDVNGNTTVSECTFRQDEPYLVQAAAGDRVVLRETWVSVDKVARSFSDEQANDPAYFCGGQDTRSVSQAGTGIYDPRCLAGC